MKKLLIVTGPQGSGNHMWSKILSLHPDVTGWSDLLNEYWIGHDQEPFADCWENIDLLKNRNWSDSEYYVTSVSCPYMLNGTATIPRIVSFAAQAMGCNLKPIIVILGRDQNILGHQESRVRGNPTFTTAVEEYAKLDSWDPTYISYELLHLYKNQYLKQLSKQLDFPIDYNNPIIDEILKDDTNKKYFQPVEHHWVDDLAKHTSRKWK
jgi:hypothetical protein